MRNLLTCVSRQNAIDYAKKITVALSLTSLVSIISCNHPVDNSITPVPASSARTATQNFLTFKDMKEFNQTVNKLLSMTEAEKDAWDTSHKFTSLRKIYNGVVAEEAANYEKEEKLYKSNPLLVGQHSKATSAALVNDLLIYSTVEGGVQLNISDPRFSAVVNQDGIVQIGSSICLFTYGQTKSIKVGNDPKKDLATLKAATQSDVSNHLYVREVKHTRRPIQLSNPNARAAAGFDVNHSCDVNNSSGWRIIIYSDEIEGTGTASYPICDSQGTCNDDDHDYQYSAYVVTFRTLKRGLFGAWYDRSSSTQNIQGAFTLSGSIPFANQFVSSLYPGQTRPYNPFSQVYYNKNNTSGETAQWQLYLFLSEPEDYSNPQVHCQNVRVTSSSVVNATWNGGYNCNCSITY